MHATRNDDRGLDVRVLKVGSGVRGFDDRDFELARKQGPPATPVPHTCFRFVTLIQFRSEPRMPNARPAPCPPAADRIATVECPSS